MEAPIPNDYIAPTKRVADIIIPNCSDSSVAIDLVVQHIRMKLQQRGMQAGNELRISFDDNEQPENLSILPRTDQIHAMQTELRDETTPRDRFIFVTTRLSRLIIEHALSLLHFEELVVQTPVGCEYVGRERDLPVR